MCKSPIYLLEQRLREFDEIDDASLDERRSLHLSAPAAGRLVLRLSEERSKCVRKRVLAEVG